MAETLGSLCDKLTIVKLKQFHNKEHERQHVLDLQEKQLREEIDEYLLSAIGGEIPLDRLTFPANKVYKKEGNEAEEVAGSSIGEVFSRLAWVNCDLWHEQEKVYEFEKVPVDEKNIVVKRLATLNLERNNCIDRIDTLFHEMVTRIGKNN